MKQLFLWLAIAAGAYHWYSRQPHQFDVQTPLSSSDIREAQVELTQEQAWESTTSFTRAQHQQQVQGRATVKRLLSDDTNGDQHQRFVIELSSGQTILVAHNIDLAPRVSPLSTGDVVEFAGEFIWNEQGGVLHWTHHDPRGQHPGGWLRAHGQLFQ